MSTHYCNRTWGPFLILGSRGGWRLPRKNTHNGINCKDLWSSSCTVHLNVPHALCWKSLQSTDLGIQGWTALFRTESLKPIHSILLNVLTLMKPFFLLFFWKEKQYRSTKKDKLFRYSFNLSSFSNDWLLFKTSFSSLTKGITRKMCRLCVYVLLNKRSFETFYVFGSLSDDLYFCLSVRCLSVCLSVSVF